MSERPTQNQKKSIRDRDNRSCQNCGRTNTELHVHHIVPLKDGGSNNPENLATLCKECHNAIHHTDKKAPQRNQTYSSESRASQARGQGTHQGPEIGGETILWGGYLIFVMFVSGMYLFFGGKIEYLLMFAMACFAALFLSMIYDRIK